MRATVLLCPFALAALVAATSAVGQTEESTGESAENAPPVVRIELDDDGQCHFTPKTPVSILVGNAPPHAQGARRVRFVYVRRGGDDSEVSLTPRSDQKHPKILDLPRIRRDQTSGETSATKEEFEGDEYVFGYDIAIERNGARILCDPDIVIRKPGG